MGGGHKTQAEEIQRTVQALEYVIGATNLLQICKRQLEKSETKNFKNVGECKFGQILFIHAGQNLKDYCQLDRK